MKNKTNILLEIVDLQEKTKLKPWHYFIAYFKNKYKLIKLHAELKEITRKESPEYIRELLKGLKTEKICN